MKVFISWSGSKSKKLANALRVIKGTIKGIKGDGGNIF